MVIVRDPTKVTLNLAVITGEKVAELKVDPKRVPKTDMINLHQGISEYLYADVLQTALQIYKLTTGKKRVEEMLRKERVENKAHLEQIKKLKMDLSIAYIPGDKGVSTQRLLKYKEGIIQLLKRKLEIPSARLIQVAELTEIEKERETLNTELVNCKSKLLI